MSSSSLTRSPMDWSFEQIADQPSRPPSCGSAPIELKAWLISCVASKLHVDRISQKGGFNALSYT